MSCRNCRVEKLMFEFVVEGEEHLLFISDIVEQFNKRELSICVSENTISIEEAGVRAFIDFCSDHIDTNHIFFRINEEPLRPISEIEQILDLQWIDDVIKEERVVCYFQPIVNAQEEIYAYEMLSRFQNEDGTMLYPNEVFTAAKERGRLYALDRLCRMTAVRYSAPLNKKAFINFIPTSIYSPEFCLKSTISLANKLGVDPSLFVFEVVETEKVDDLDHLKEILTYYNERGFQYALDDVGEGHSTIKMLSDLKPHFMKLDMKYVQGVAKDSTKQEVANSFLEKALEIGSVPLAEGVETQEDFEWLKEKGYQLFQGYLFGKPSPDPKR